jgi:hypothetical protein
MVASAAEMVAGLLVGEVTVMKGGRVSMSTVREVVAEAPLESVAVTSMA